MTQDTIQKINDLFWPWLLERGPKIILIIAIAFVARIFIRVFIEKSIRRIIKPDQFASPDNEKRRENTLIQIANSIMGIFIWAIAAFMVLSELGLNIGPLLAGAGVIGVAVGFGGQYIISDFLGGLSVILENQYKVGDVICVDKTCGTVEDITLRITTLRDLDGTVHYISNGNVKQVANLTQQFARINLDIGVSYNSNLEKVIEVINRVGKEMAEDAEWKDKILTAPQFLRVDDFADSAVMVKILGKTKPMEQWAATGELRKRLKIAFDKEGIEIPFPQRVVHQAKDV